MWDTKYSSWISKWLIKSLLNQYSATTKYHIPHPYGNLELQTTFPRPTTNMNMFHDFCTSFGNVAWRQHWKKSKDFNYGHLQKQHKERTQNRKKQNESYKMHIWRKRFNAFTSLSGNKAADFEREMNLHGMRWP